MREDKPIIRSRCGFDSTPFPPLQQKPKAKTFMPINNERKKYFRQIGHDLKPLVTIAGKGLSDTVLKEIERALEDHELIKLKLNVDDRESMREEVCQRTHAELVQSIGKVVLIYREAKNPNPKLSNLLAKK